jgi:myo-inositol 2-dehydrogenase/D-chiro-inositol 1-dehydrogenase
MRVAVAGSGRMARVRAAAFASLGDGVEICGIASRSVENAQRLAAELRTDWYTDYAQLLAARPDALLVEVPHRPQDDLVTWALRAGLHVMIGGPLASSAEAGRRIAALAAEQALVVETGYEARYKDVWRLSSDLVSAGVIGDIISVQSLALVQQDTVSWYYQEEISGGMLVTHLSYAFLNPLRWIFGTPRWVVGNANRKHLTTAAAVRHETCAASVLWPNDILGTMLAGYVKPPNMKAWHVDVVGTGGGIRIEPGDLHAGSVTLFKSPGGVVRHDFDSNNAFVEQARAFYLAVTAGGPVLNPPEDAQVDLQVCEALRKSIDCGGMQVRL